MTRLFVALQLPETLRQAISQLGAGIRGARWLDPDDIHLTLRFIGDVDGADFRDIHQALDNLRSEPFELYLSGVGHFPPRGTPRTLWIGVQENDSLVRLQRRVDQTLMRLGHASEHRKYKAHVTVARLQQGTPINRIRTFLVEHSLLRFEPFLVDEFCLYSSQLHPDGARYTVEECYGLGMA